MQYSSSVRTALGSARLGLSLVCRCHHDVSCCRWSHARHCIKLHKIDDWQWHVERCIYNVIDVSVFVSLSVCLSSSLIASHAVARQQERLLYRVRSRHWHSDWDWDYMGLWDCVHGMRYTSIPQWTHKAHYHITVSVCVWVCLCLVNYDIEHLRSCRSRKLSCSYSGKLDKSHVATSASEFHIGYLLQSCTV